MRGEKISPLNSQIYAQQQKHAFLQYKIYFYFLYIYIYFKSIAIKKTKAKLTKITISNFNGFFF